MNPQNEDAERERLMAKIALWRRVYFVPRAPPPLRPLRDDEEEQLGSELPQPKRILNDSAFLKRRRELLVEEQAAREACRSSGLEELPSNDACSSIPCVKMESPSSSIQFNYEPSPATSAGIKRFSRRDRNRRRLEQRAAEWDPASNPNSIGISGHTIIVSSLPQDATEDDLTAFGQRFGKVTSVRLVLAGRRATQRANRRRQLAEAARVRTRKTKSSDTLQFAAATKEIVHAGYGFVAFARPNEVTTVLNQHAKVRDGTASAAQQGQFRIKKQLVCCDVERGRGASSHAMATAEESSAMSVSLAIQGKPKPFSETHVPAHIMGNDGWLRDYRQRLRSLRHSKAKGLAAYHTAMGQGKYIPKSLRTVADFCTMRK